MPRILLALTILAVVVLDAGADPVPLTDTTQSPHAILQPVGIDEVRWTTGFWAERYRVCREQTVPSMWELMRDSRYKPFLEHFLIAAGKSEGDYHGAVWNDGDFYKWVEAACSLIASQPDSDLASAVDQAVGAIVAAQRDDGYIHTPVLIRQRNGDPTAKPFSDRHDFEVYNLGHLMTAGCVHYRVTGRRDLLTAAERAAGFLEKAFNDPTPQMARQAVCPSHYMGLLELHRTTGKSCYLRQAERVIALRSVASGVGGGGGDDNQDRVPFLEQREAVGHAVRANYLYAGVADLYLETGDPQFVAPLEAVWRNVTQKKLYVTGACGALYDGASPDASARQDQITRVHQAYGRNYQLPSTTAHNETCAAVGAVLWNWRRLLATGESRHADWMELAMHNAVLSGVSLSGTEYFYVNPLRAVRRGPTELRWSRRRKPFIVSFCCPPNVARTMAQLSGYAYSKSPGCVWTHLYGSNRLTTEVEGSPFELTQTTNYPWDGAVEFHIEQAPTEVVTLKLRKPDWADSLRVAVNGEPLEVKETNGYANVKRKWKSGDKLTLSLPMPVVLLESHPLVEETRNQLAVKRGPVVYCLESTDLPPGVKADEVGISPDTEFHVAFDPELLGGVAVLEADLPIATDQPWETLYRPTKPGKSKTARCRLIPYFVWGNRGDSEMTVWMPRR